MISEFHTLIPRCNYSMSHLSIDSSMTIVFDASGKPMSKPTGDDGDAAANDDQEEETQPLIDVTKLKSNTSAIF